MPQVRMPRRTVQSRGSRTRERQVERRKGRVTFYFFPIFPASPTPQTALFFRRKKRIFFCICAPRHPSSSLTASLLTKSPRGRLREDFPMRLLSHQEAFPIETVQFIIVICQPGSHAGPTLPEIRSRAKRRFRREMCPSCADKSPSRKA